MWVQLTVGNSVWPALLSVVSSTDTTTTTMEPMQVDPEENENNFVATVPIPKGSRLSNNPGPLLLGGHGAAGSDTGGADDDFRGDEGALWTVENPSIDLESYAQGYSGLARLHRLSFIANHCPLLRVESLRLALQHVMQSFNTSTYVALHKKLVDALNAPSASLPSGSAGNLPDLTATGPSSSGNEAKLPQYDQHWVEQKAKKAALKLEKLDTDLKNYKSNSIKESIRRGHDDLGDHYLDCGDLQNALKAYSRARDYCTSGRHVVNMCLNVIKVSVYLQNWSHVISYVNKAMATPDYADVSGTVKSADHQIILTRLNCAIGLAELATRKYKVAARHFLSASLDHCDIPDMMSTQNVTTYGGLCALATFERPELQKLVISSTNFKLFLELDPQLREIIFSFYESKYGQCLKLLEEIRENLLLDLYLASHVNTLYSLIRNRGLVQYFSPYLSADMRLMASFFNTTLAGLEEELMNLILDGQIQARIDSHKKVLYAQDVDQRSATFEKAMEMGELYQRRAKLMILRSALLKNNVLVKTVHRVGAAGGGADPAEGGPINN